MSNFLDKLNIVLAIIFAIEAAMKITGFGFSPYLSDSWNRLCTVSSVYSRRGR
jgi:hypothetical protein